MLLTKAHRNPRRAYDANGAEILRGQGVRSIIASYLET
jgi:hypothetical protein